VGCLALLAAGCGARPQQAAGVSSGPVVHYLLCHDDRVTAVTVTAPSGRVLWRRRFPGGTTRERVPLPRLEPPFRVSGPDGGEPVLEVDRVPAQGILRGDGRLVSAAEFEAGRDGYCGAARKDRAAALAVGFAFVCLAAVFTTRWLRAKQSRDPYDRPYR
jgi:hypothetical protein